MLRAVKTPKGGRHETKAAALKRAKKNIYRQSLLAALVVFLTVIILFAITAAWYTNIAQTSGLVFEAETWGFEGSVNLGTTGALKAAPGEEGIISLTAENTGNTTAAVGVNVNKAKMEEEMQKRIYFYVDAAKTVNGEQVDRVYLNSAMNYTYTLFSGDTLTLTEDVNNEALIKWHWVYDVLGYYVKGSFNGSTFVEEEYIRPIEYDFDEANTTFEIVTDPTTGKKEYAGLSTIDGKLTAEEFIVDFSKHDGYEGEIDPQNTGEVNGYYPIAVDSSTGRGIWAYMCSYSEIYMNTQLDTKLGTGEVKYTDAQTAVITLSAQNTEVETTTVDTANALLTVLEKVRTSGETAYIQLTDSISLSDPILLENMEKVVIDLNGNTLTVPMAAYSDHNAGIQLSEGSSLSLYNGTLSGEEAGGIAVYSQGAEVNLRGVTMDNVGCAVYVRDDWGDEGCDSRIRITNSVFNCSEEGIYLSGNGAASSRMTQLIVENSTITSDYIAIMGNGNDTQWGTDVQIINSTLSGHYAGIYQPQRNSTLTVSGSKTEINGNTGIALKAGCAKIYEGAIVGTGAYGVMAEVTSMPLSGFHDTGDGIYIETNYGYDIELEVYGGTISAAKSAEGACALRVYEEDAENVSVKIYGGTFTPNIDSKYKVEVPTEAVAEDELADDGQSSGDDQTETETGDSSAAEGESTETGTETQPDAGSEQTGDAVTEGSEQTDNEEGTTTEGGDTTA